MVKNKNRVYGYCHEETGQSRVIEEIVSLLLLIIIN